MIYRIIIWFHNNVDNVLCWSILTILRSFNLDDTEQTTNDVSDATDKSVARTHITLYVILFLYTIWCTIYIGDSEQTNNKPFTLDDNEKTTDDISPATKSVACIHPYSIIFVIVYFLYYTMLTLSISTILNKHSIGHHLRRYWTKMTYRLQPTNRLPAPI